MCPAGRVLSIIAYTEMLRLKQEGYIFQSSALSGERVAILVVEICEKVRNRSVKGPKIYACKRDNITSGLVICPHNNNNNNNNNIRFICMTIII